MISLMDIILSEDAQCSSCGKKDPIGRYYGPKHLCATCTSKAHDTEQEKKGYKKVVTPNKNPTTGSSTTWVKNPDTDKTIDAKSAIKAGPDHPAYNAAKSALDKK